MAKQGLALQYFPNTLIEALDKTNYQSQKTFSTSSCY